MKFTTHTNRAPNFALNAHPTYKWRTAEQGNRTFTLVALGEGTGGWGRNSKVCGGWGLFVNGKLVWPHALNRASSEYFRPSHSECRAFKNLAESRRAAEAVAANPSLFCA